MASCASLLLGEPVDLIHCHITIVIEIETFVHRLRPRLGIGLRFGARPRTGSWRLSRAWGSDQEQNSGGQALHRRSPPLQFPDEMLRGRKKLRKEMTRQISAADGNGASRAPPASVLLRRETHDSSINAAAALRGWDCSQFQGS